MAMLPPTVTYNHEIDQKLRKRLRWPDAKLPLSDEDFLDSVLNLNKEALEGLAAPQARAEILFHVLVQAGRRRPNLFPVPDLCLAAFNILSARHNLAESRLVCLDLGLLPTAVLATGWGAKVALPSGSKSWPEHLCPAAGTDNRDMQKALVLGRDPVKLTEDNPAVLDDLVKAEGGIIFCHWDFLGLKLHTHIRLKWLERGLIRTLIQFPRPTRQGAFYYPALIEIASSGQRVGQDQPKIRLADVRASAAGPGELPQTEVLRVALGQADGENSLDISLKELAGREDAAFAPRRLLAGPRGIGEVPLAGRARLIRCQSPRLKPGDGLFTCLEVSLSYMDELTGFVIPGAGHLVGFKDFNPLGREGEYLLRRHDILMCFRGTEATIGRVGLVAVQPEEPLISGQSYCIIRAFDDFDPIYLYYYLRREEVRRRVLSRSSGSNMLTVNLGDLRELPIAQPGPTQSAIAGEMHGRLLSLMGEIQQLYGRARTELEAYFNKPVPL